MNPPVPIHPEREVGGIEAGEVEDVATGIARHGESIPTFRPSLHHRLEVREVVGELEQRSQHHVEVGSPSRRTDTHAGLAQRPRQALGDLSSGRDAAGQQRNARVQGRLTVSGVALDTEHGRDSTAVLGAEAA